MILSAPVENHISFDEAWSSLERVVSFLEQLSIFPLQFPPSL